MKSIIPIFMASLALLHTVAWAGVRLPLGGYYRAGRYMPVQLTDAASHTIKGEGILPSVFTSAAPDVVVPVLVLDSSAGPIESMPLHELKPDERLVLSVADTTIDAKPLFPTNKLIVLHVDRELLNDSPACAWTAADALIVDMDMIHRWDDQRIGDFLAGGTSVAVRADHPPGTRWPWRRRGGYWVLSPVPAGPTSARIDETAYRPTYTWTGDWPASFRAALLAAIVAFVLLAIAASLLRRPWRMVSIVVLAGASAALLIGWRREGAPLLHINGVIEVHSDSLLNRDHWFYQTAPDGLEGGFAWAGWTMPIFASIHQRQSLDMRLMCDSSGRPIGFQYHLPRNVRIAFLTRRTMLAGHSSALKSAELSPLRELASRLYLSGHTRIVGQSSPPPGGAWPTVVVQMQHPE